MRLEVWNIETFHAYWEVKIRPIVDYHVGRPDGYDDTMDELEMWMRFLLREAVFGRWDPRKENEKLTKFMKHLQASIAILHTMNPDIFLHLSFHQDPKGSAMSEFLRAASKIIENEPTARKVAGEGVAEGKNWYAASIVEGCRNIYTRRGKKPPTSVSGDRQSEKPVPFELFAGEMLPVFGIQTYTVRSALRVLATVANPAGK